jgi:hypothetical protein
VPISVPPVHVDAVEVGDDLRAGALVVRERVRRVLVLERHHPARVLGDQLLRQPHRAVRSLVGGRLDDLGAVQLEQLPPLLGCVRRHDARQRIVAQLRDERERDAGVARGGLEQPLPGLELDRLEHLLRDAVLDRAGRVLPFELRVDRHGARLRRQPRQLDERGVADEIEQRARDRHRFSHRKTVGQSLPSSW